MTKMNEYNYAAWLKTHAGKKTLMEKLERSLVPFPLFSDMDFEALHVGHSGEVENGRNTYRYVLLSRSMVNEREVFLFRLYKVRVNDVWNDLLMGFSDFKVILHEGKVVTIYPFREQYFNQIIGMFEAEQYFDLYRQKTLYVKNLLARYVLLKLLHEHKQGLSLLYSVCHHGNVIPVLAGKGSKEMVMYAFSKREANDLAMQLRGLQIPCEKLTVVYFINRNFENEKANHNVSLPGVEVASIKQFYRGLDLNAKERGQVERQIFFLIEMLYEQRLEWDENHLKSCIRYAPRMSDRNFCWMEVPKMLVEDALNVLVEDYDNPKDIFHMLCAANLVNTYTNRYKDRKKNALRSKGRSAKSEKTALNRRVHTMYRFKTLVMQTIVHLLELRSHHLKVALAPSPRGNHECAVLAQVRIEGHDFQFKFRGVHPAFIKRFLQLGVSDKGQCDCVRWQPVAPALYLYSYHMKWNA